MIKSTMGQSGTTLSKLTQFAKRSFRVPTTTNKFQINYNSLKLRSANHVAEQEVPKGQKKKVPM